MDSALEIPQLTRTEEYDDPAVLTMPDHSWLVRTTADMVAGGPAEEINVEAYWADVFGNNWGAKAPEENNKAAEEAQAAMDREMAAYWTELFGEWGQDEEDEEDWDPLDYDDDAGEVYDMLLLE